MYRIFLRDAGDITMDKFDENEYGIEGERTNSDEPYVMFIPFTSILYIKKEE